MMKIGDRVMVTASLGSAHDGRSGVLLEKAASPDPERWDYAVQLDATESRRARVIGVWDLAVKPLAV